MKREKSGHLPIQVYVTKNTYWFFDVNPPIARSGSSVNPLELDKKQAWCLVAAYLNEPMPLNSITSSPVSRGQPFRGSRLHRAQIINYDKDLPRSSDLYPTRPRDPLFRGSVWSPPRTDSIIYQCSAARIPNFGRAGENLDPVEIWPFFCRLFSRGCFLKIQLLVAAGDCR